MSKHANDLKVLLADLRHLVEGHAPKADLRAFSECLREPDVDAIDPAPAAVSFGLPACRFWQTTLHEADSPVRGIATALLELGPSLTWVQNPNYRRASPSRGFLDNYGYAVIAGPRDGAPALVRCEACAVGVLLLGPRTVYPRHHHPATEVYVPLNEAEWWREDGPWRTEPAGTVIYHGSNMQHATRTAAQPLLAVYLWRGELSVHARMVTEPQSCRT